MENINISAEQQAALDEFRSDSRIIGVQTEHYLRLVYPAYLVDPANIEDLLDQDSSIQLDGMTFYRICSCAVGSADKLFETINTKVEKLFTALHSIGVSVAYGLVSQGGQTNLVLGVYSKNDVQSVENITQGMLSGIRLEATSPQFCNKSHSSSYGILSGIPSLYLREQKQTFSLSSVMRSLNGQDYMLLFIARPVRSDLIAQNISELISIRDAAFAVSKRNIARSHSYSKTQTHTDNVNDGKNSVAGQVGGGAGAAGGAVAGAIIGSIVPVVGTMLGATVGGAVGGGLGTIIGNIVGRGKTHSEGYSDSISEAITDGDTVSGDIQNGFALELMNYADKAIERLKGGQTSGMWQTAIAFSGENAMTVNIIKACLCGELSKPDPDKLPLLSFQPKTHDNEKLRIPAFLGADRQNPLCSNISSSELGLLCTFPTESVPDFEVRIQKDYPLVRSPSSPSSAPIGYVTDGKRPLYNMPFALNKLDLNKHTFICGITGSGKTTTVKKILVEAHVPFLVIESAKKEYRNLAIDTEVFTLGKSEINCPQINPFYVMSGVSLQTHIDYLKDLFNASFSFYGPMPYILDKCLYSIYRNRGWNLALGYHPLLANSRSQAEFFSIEYIRKRYASEAHKFLFPTMQELKDEIARYIEEELKYDGEVAGNVKTAMKVRLENLCVGAKGYAFNTHDCLDFSNILGKNVVFELEGLADDSDKAFCVGLLVIFINEYRQVMKELSGNRPAGLEHLLVIEEAHRLLKNVDTERSTEDQGNPKGKAVEHFTNMLAEMRSYGQGVIVAEQIPSKLAPDVIKNSSTKIVQRIVSVDDQQIIANTIGISADDALQLGSLESGYALCHKEGMALPTAVKILNSFVVNGESQGLDVYVSDEELYNSNEDRFKRLNKGIIRTAFDGEGMAKQRILALLNTLLIEPVTAGVSACEDTVHEFELELNRKDISLIFCRSVHSLIAEYIVEGLLRLLTNGVYAVNELPSAPFVESLVNTLSYPAANKVGAIKEELTKLYGQDCSKLGKQIITGLILRVKKNNTNLVGTISSYFSIVSENTIADILTGLGGR